MGRAKDELMRKETLYFEGQSIAVEAGAIKECEFHSGTYLNCDDPEANSRAYAIGTIRWKEAKGDKESRKVLMDAIKTAINDAGAECYSCEKWRRD